MNGAFVCVGLFIMYCHPVARETQRPAVAHSFCQAYQRILRTEEEGRQLGRIESRAVRERVAANETLYQCACAGVDLPICREEARMAAAQVR